MEPPALLDGNLGISKTEAIEFHHMVRVVACVSKAA